jgi:hypothetical protein
MEDLVLEIDNIGKNNQTIAEAFKEIGLVKEAFEKSARIEYKINQNQLAITDLKARMELLSTSAYVDFKTEKLQRMIDVLVKTKFDEYTSHLLIEISHKISDLEAKKLFDQKVNWTSFNEFKNTYGAIKLKLDTFIEADFSNYKLRIENEVKRQNEEVRKIQETSREELEKIKTKMQEVEDKIDQIVAEEEPSVKENQSEVDFDKMIGEIEKNLLSEDSPSKIINLRSIESVQKASRSELIRKNSLKEPKSPLTGFEVSRSERPTEFFGSAVSPTYKKPAFDVLSRRSSAVSTAGPGGIKQIGRKVMTMEKDISDIFHEILSFKKKFEKIEKELKNVQDQVESLFKRCDSIEEFEKKLEQSFVYRLRAKDMQNELRKNRVLVEKVPGDDLVKINKEISEKNKKISQIDHYLKYLVTEVEYLKHHQTEKFKSFQESLNTIERDKKHQEREFHTLKTNFSMIESGLSDGISKVYDESTSLKAPMSELMKDRDFSNVRIRRRSQDIRNSEESKHEKTLSTRNKRGMSATPKVSVQSKVVFII